MSLEARLLKQAIRLNEDVKKLNEEDVPEDTTGAEYDEMLAVVGKDLKALRLDFNLVMHEYRNGALLDLRNSLADLSFAAKALVDKINNMG